MSDDGDGSTGGTGGESDYTVEIKQSARQVSPGAGQWVVDHGPQRTFPTKPMARSWARSLSPPERTVWVQDTAPHDPSTVDGYVVGGRRPGVRQHEDPGEQSELDEDENGSSTSEAPGGADQQ